MAAASDAGTVSRSARPSVYIAKTPAKVTARVNQAAMVKAGTPLDTLTQPIAAKKPGQPW